MPLLWYIEWEVRLGNNQTYTSKSQKWHIPSKATKITWTCYINEIETKQNKQTNKKQGTTKFSNRKTIKQSAVQSFIQKLK